MSYRHQPVPVVMGPPIPPGLIARSRELLEATLALVPPIGIREAIRDLVMPRFPEHAARANEVASEIGVSISAADVFTANLCYDIFSGSRNMGCSTLALAGADGPVLSRNMDWFPEEKIARASCLIHESTGINAGFVGLIGVVTALSNRGFALCLNEALGETDPTGYPMLLFLRHVMDNAGGFDQAVEMVRTESLMSSGIVTLVGRTNRERVIIERMPNRAVVRQAAGDDPLIATNHFLALSKGESCPRYDYLEEFAGSRPAMDLLTHPEVLQVITAQHVVAKPAQGTIAMTVPSHLLDTGYRSEIGPEDVFGV